MRNRNALPRMLLAPALLVLLLWSPVAPSAEALTVEGLIARVKSPDVEVRYAARSEAPAVGAPAVPALVSLIDESQLAAGGDEAAQRLRREIAITAKAALENLVHHAGRPGAEVERVAVAAALAGQLSPDTTLKTKREVVHLIGFVGSDSEVPAAAALLRDGDKNVREAARLVLERIPGKAATQALLAAARTQPDDQKSDLIISIGRKGDRTVTPALLEWAREGRGSVRMASLAALAQLGAPEAVDLFMRLLGDPDLPERGAVGTELLQLADEMAARDELEEAAEVYRGLVSKAPFDYQRERALYQLTKGVADIEALLVAMGDSSDRVRRFALARLEVVDDPRLIATLRDAYSRVPQDARPTLLRVLAEKDAEKAQPLVAEAAGSSHPELKLTALELQDRLLDPSLEGLYLSVAETGVPAAKRIALKGYLLLADQALDDGKKEKAFSMYTKALELATVDEQRVVALRGLVALGDPRALEQLTGLLKGSALANEAARGFIQLAAKLGAQGDKDKAEEYLMQVVAGDLPKDLRNEAAQELRKLGRDPQRAAREQGFVVDWWLLTPIQDPDGKGLETKYFPEETIDLVNEQRIGPRKFRWQELTEVSMDGRINLLTSFRRTANVITYAYTEIESPKAQNVLFKMGSDDGIACWLNGERLHLNNAARGLTADQDVVPAKVKAGKNKVLLKISNGGGDWGFAFRITDPDGKPLPLPAGAQ